jgi:hypothetical protein
LQNNDLQLIQPTTAEEEILLSQPPNLEKKTVEELLNIDLDMFPVFTTKSSYVSLI